MIENSYLIGLTICAKISLGIGIILLILMAILAVREDLQGPQDGIYLNIFVLFCFGVGVSISSFLVIYPLLNLILQKFWSLELYRNEISQGTLALRITSLLLGFNFLKSLYNFWEDILRNNQNNQKKPMINFLGLQEISSVMDEDDINVVLVSQNLIYGAVTLLLWIFIFLSKSFLELRVVTWGLFFIVDDWAIISENLVALKGRVLKSHKLRIVFFNALLSIFIISACFRELNNLLFSIFISVMLFALLIVNAKFLIINNNKKERKEV